MISYQALGRQQFGNQLFQYAFLRTTARRLGVRFYCPEWRGTGLLRLEDDEEREMRPEGVDKTYVEPARYFGLNTCAQAVTDGTDVYGFFQTEQYWPDAASVRRWFRFREDRTKRVRDKYHSMGSEDVGLHVRLTDKTTVEGRIRYYAPGVRYYEDALQKLGPRERVLVFSDDIAGARKVLHGLRANLVYIEGNEDYEDLYLMTRCRDFICSVSTFSWWGAWLGENSGRKVVCPSEGPTRPGCEVQNQDYWPAPWIKVRALRGLVQDARVVGAVERGQTLDQAGPLAMSQDVILVTGAGGFIGGHLVAHLLEQGHARVRAVDVQPLADWHQRFDGVENLVLDLRLPDACRRSCEDVLDVYQLASDMGGMGFIENNKAACMLNVLINTHMLMAARDQGVARFFFSSSACVYDTAKQSDTATAPLKESDAYPAMPEDGYGWEKLFSERMCRHFTEDFGLQTRVARFHNVYGPNGPWDGGREKAPAAICRKVIEAIKSDRHEIEVWGSGQQTRSFMYIDDCIRGIDLIMKSTRVEPINLGSSEMVSIDGLVEMVERIAGVTLTRTHAPLMPQGVRGRSSDNAEILAAFGWEPRTPLFEGLVRTYQWIEQQHAKKAQG